MTPFALIIHFFVSTHCLPKVGYVTPHDPLDIIFAFVSLALTATPLYAKIEVYSFKRSRDIRGSQNSKKWVT